MHVDVYVRMCLFKIKRMSQHWHGSHWRLRWGTSAENIIDATPRRVLLVGSLLRGEGDTSYAAYTSVWRKARVSKVASPNGGPGGHASGAQGAIEAAGVARNDNEDDCL